MQLTESGKNHSILSLDSALADRHSLARALHNDLEEAVSDGFPVVRHLKERMIELGALGAVMSGSGPTVLAVVNSRAQAEEMAGSLAADGNRAFALRATESAHQVCH
jgi:4-diphosphocytidyl-2C-methyl-D-erythritol kinase